MVLKPSANLGASGILNPACARLRDNTLQLYPRMVAPGNISRIGSFGARESVDGAPTVEFEGFALEPEVPYELRDGSQGYGCEDPRVTFVPAIDRYVMAYVAFGPRGPEVAVAASEDGLRWNRLGLVQFEGSDLPFADKDAAFFPEPVLSGAGVESLALYHRPTLQLSATDANAAIAEIEALPPERREGISIAYVPLENVRKDLSALCNVSETHRLTMPPANWGAIKVGAGAPPIRIAEGWLSIIHGVDRLAHPDGGTLLRYCAGVIIHDLRHLEDVVFRSQEPLFVPESGAELQGAVGHVVFPTGIDRIGEREFDIYYGMADYESGCGRLTLDD
ncbi:MAG: glycosidase [Candidatus Eremiobacteraeota bacterium]|nr:glycosidase [Candidatus Eremiobacteraeota bacterium]